MDGLEAKWKPRASAGVKLDRMAGADGGRVAPVKRVGGSRRGGGPLRALRVLGAGGAAAPTCGRRRGGGGRRGRRLVVFVEDHLVRIEAMLLAEARGRAQHVRVA